MSETGPDFYDPDVWTTIGHNEALRQALGVTSLRSAVDVETVVNDIGAEVWNGQQQ